MIEFSELVKPKALEQGEWVDWGHGIELLIRPAGNRDYTLFVSRQAMKRAAAEETPRRKRFEDEEATVVADVEQSMEAQMEAIASTVLAGWRGILDDGEALAYTPEKGVELFKADHETYQLVIAEANRIARAALKIAKDAEGNSGSA